VSNPLAGITPPQISALVEKLRRIPDSARTFQRFPEWAFSGLRIGPDLRIVTHDGEYLPIFLSSRLLITADRPGGATG
jgi:hypothetical protein